MDKEPLFTRTHRLTRLFAISSLMLIALACIAFSLLISSIVTEKMIQRDTETTTAFVQSLAVVQEARGYFLGNMPPDQNLEEFFRHVSAMPDVVRANIYARDRTVLWSTNPALVGKRFTVNEELDAIFMERDESRTGIIGAEVPSKAEHLDLDRDDTIIETYVGVLDPQTRLVMGAIEFYKNPQPLWQTIRTLKRNIWLVAIGMGVLLYSSLIIFMIRLSRQYKQLNPDFAMAKIMALAVSRGMKNSATPEVSSHTGAREAKSEKLGAWAESLKRYADEGPAHLSAVSLPELVKNSLVGLQEWFDAGNTRFSMDFPVNLPPIHVDPVWLQVALDSIIHHAINTMPPGGVLSVSARSDDMHHAVYLEMRDSGGGLDSGPRPCEATSNDLELARNLINRMGGKLILAPLIDGACDRTLRMDIAPSSLAS